MDRFLILGDDRAEEKAEMKKKMLELIDIYYDALDAPKKGDKVYLPNKLKPDIFPHYMERDKKFQSTSILGLIFDFVKSQTTEEPSPSSGKGPLLVLLYTYNQITKEIINHDMCFTVVYNLEISKLPCFEDEPVSEFHMQKCRLWYDNYRTEMTQAMKTDKDESANEVIQRYKQVRSSIRCHHSGDSVKSKSKDLTSRLHESPMFC